MLKNAVLCLAACALLAGSGCEFLDQNPDEMLGLVEPAPEASEFSPSQIVEKMREATDPKHFFRDCKSYILRQSVRSGEKSGNSWVERVWSNEIKFRQPGMLRQTTVKDGNPFKILIYRDGKGWSVDPHSKTATEYRPGTGYNLFLTFIRMNNPQSTIMSLFSTVEAAVVYPDGKRQYRLVCRVDDPNIAPYVLYVDAQTFRTVRIETVSYMDDGAQYLYRAEPLEYKWVGDVQISMKTRVVTGKQECEYTTDEFLLNANIPDSDFALPAQVKIKYE